MLFESDPALIYIDSAPEITNEPFTRHLRQAFDSNSLAGNYLASQFAQRHHDWDKASKNLERILKFDKQNIQLLSRAMILSMGSGQFEDAVQYAQRLSAVNNQHSLAALFLAVNSLKTQNYEQALRHVEQMPEGSLSEFMMPLILSWAKAGVGEYEIKDLQHNTIHIYHTILISDFLGRSENIEPLLQRSLNAQGLTLEDIQHIADLYTHIDKPDLATALYQKILDEWAGNAEISNKVKTLTNAPNTNYFTPITTPEHGAAEALYDMALLLFREYSDDSARVFVNMAYALNPDMTKATMLMGHIATRNDNVDDAIAHYRSIPQNSNHFLEASRLAANLLEDMGRDDEALGVLRQLYQEYQDVNSLIQIGDIYRRNDDFENAINSYNDAETLLGNIGKDYWHIYYLRGMSYEQNQQWLKAEKDLKAALAFQPDHALIMNYLGYSWADQGINLEESLTLVKKAAAQESSDAYITDSLGWVLYRMGRFAEAVPHLEKAIELMPYDPVINDHLGDAYWRMGRKREAQFQWLRAKNHAQENEELIESATHKLENGLNAPDLMLLRQANTQEGQSNPLKQ